jgi:hypothetical protein
MNPLDDANEVTLEARDIRVHLENVLDVDVDRELLLLVTMFPVRGDSHESLEGDNAPAEGTRIHSDMALFPIDEDDGDRMGL